MNLNINFSHFKEIHGSITGLSDVCRKRVEKAHRVVKDMVANIAFFFVMISQYMDSIGLSENERQIMNDYLIPCFYLQQTARKENDKVRKEIIKNKSEEFLSMISDPDGPLSGYSDRRIEFLTGAAKDCANFFQRRLIGFSGLYFFALNNQSQLLDGLLLFAISGGLTNVKPIGNGIHQHPVKKMLAEQGGTLLVLDGQGLKRIPYNVVGGSAGVGHAGQSSLLV